MESLRDCTENCRANSVRYLVWGIDVSKKSPGGARLSPAQRAKTHLVRSLLHTGTRRIISSQPTCYFSGAVKRPVFLVRRFNGAVEVVERRFALSELRLLQTGGSASSV
jgi:hypothetical protein